MAKVPGPSAEFVLRLVGALVLTITGVQAGLSLYQRYPDLLPVQVRVLLPLLGFMVGLVLTPYFTTRPARAVRRWVAQLPAPLLFTAIAGLFFGLLLSALLSIPLWLIPLPWVRGLAAPILTGLITYSTIMLFLTRQRDVWALLQGRYANTLTTDAPEGYYLVDTSALIDGRLLALARLGFPRGVLIVPRFVLQELQSIADSSEAHKRRRGRRGLENLQQLQELRMPRVMISDVEVLDTTRVDEKLVQLARRLDAPIITTDYNLAQVARLRGVPVLHLHELAQALQVPVLPGDVLSLELVQAGKGEDQGVAFLEDGTMVVVEQGRPYIGQTIQVTVTKVLPTQGGRIIFARPLQASPQASS